MKETDVATAAKLLSSGSHKYVDVRTESEFAGERGAGAVCAEV